MLTHSEFPLNGSCVKHDSNYISSHPTAQISLNYSPGGWKRVSGGRAMLEFPESGSSDVRTGRLWKTYFLFRFVFETGLL